MFDALKAIRYVVLIVMTVSLAVAAQAKASRYGELARIEPAPNMCS